MNYNFLYKISVVGIFFLLLPTTFVHGADYVPLVGIPGLEGPLTFDKYINALYGLSISIAALMAVVKLIIAGLKWMLSDVVTSKQEAISDIQGSVFGLLIVLSAVLVLNTINPNLTKNNTQLSQIQAPPVQPAVGPPGAPLISTDTYFQARAGSIPNFVKVKCSAPGQLYKVYFDSKVGSMEVCFEPLTDAFKEGLTATFGNKGITMDDLFLRYQLGYIHSLSPGDMDQVKLKEGVSTVYAVLVWNKESNPTWLDDNNRKSIDALCQDFKRTVGSEIKVKSITGEFHDTKGYYACVTP